MTILIIFLERMISSLYQVFLLWIDVIIKVEF